MDFVAVFRSTVFDMGVDHVKARPLVKRTSATYQTSGLPPALTTFLRSDPSRGIVKRKSR